MQIKRKLTTRVADSQPIADMFKKREKLAPNADETKKINRAVAEFLCMDMIPIYPGTVLKRKDSRILSRV